MKKKIEKGTEFYRVFTTWWTLFQELHVPEESEEYWQNVHDKCNEFVNQFKERKSQILAKHLFVATLNYLGEVYKDEKTENA